MGSVSGKGSDDKGVTESAAVHCIADDGQWLAAIKACAESSVVCMSWQDFNAAPMDFASAKGIALARMDEPSNEYDLQLGRLCRSFPGGVVVELAAGLAILQDERFFAHGFRKISHLSREPNVSASQGGFSDHLQNHLLNGDERFFEYRLQDYKAVPDWLNARYWAHPERFHLYR